MRGRAARGRRDGRDEALEAARLLAAAALFLRIDAALSVDVLGIFFCRSVSLSAH